MARTRVVVGGGALWRVKQWWRDYELNLSSVLKAVVLIALAAEIAFVATGRLVEPRSVVDDTKKRPASRVGKKPSHGALGDWLPGTSGSELFSGREPRGTRHTSVGGGYSFRAPVGWDVQADGTATRLTSGDGDLVVSLGLASGASDASMEATLDKAVSLLKRSYEEVSVKRSRLVALDTGAAVRVQGTATNEAGIPLGTAIYMIRNEGKIYVIAAFWVQRGGGDASNDRVLRIVRSFRILGAPRAAI